MPAGACFARAAVVAAALVLPIMARADEPPSPPDSQKLWTFSAGLGSSKAWNLVGVTREFFVGANTSLFIAAGLGEMILGAGAAYYGNREGDGVVASIVAGTGLQAALTYRWRLGDADYLAAGASYIRVFGFSDIDHPQFVPVVSYERRF